MGAAIPSTAKAALSLSIISVLLATMSGAVYGQLGTAGVSSGDWFKYVQSTVLWSSNYPNPTFAEGRSQFIEVNDTAWFQMSVQQIVGPSIYLQTLEHFRNQTEKTAVGFVDVNSGGGNKTGSVVSANLNVNDTVYSLFNSSWRVNDTTTKTYLNSTRETNHVNDSLVLQAMFISDNGTTYNGTRVQIANYYWDRTSGIIVEFTYEEYQHTGPYESSLSYSYMITDSSVWVVPEFPYSSTLPVLIIVTIATGIIYTRKSTRK